MKAVLRDAPVQAARFNAVVTTAIVLKTDAETVKTVAAEVKRMADMGQSFNNLKQLALALHNYHAANNHFPPRRRSPARMASRC